MKPVLQTLMIVGGGVGLIISAPIALFGYSMFRGFGGDLTSKDRMMFGLPFFAAGLLAAGIVWRRSDKQLEKESRE